MKPKIIVTRKIPDSVLYDRRVEHELDIIESKNLVPNLMRALDILKLVKNIPHITRGSCGSSLVCYLYLLLYA